MKAQLKADLLLIIVAMLWGSSCLLTKVGLGGLQEFNLTALRFIIAFLLSTAVFFKRFRHIDIKTVKYAATLAAILFTVFVFMTFGVRFTTASNAGFLTCLAGVFIPVIVFIFLKQKPDKKTVLCICLAFVGTYLLTVNEQMQFNIGDILCILCSLAFAVHILVTGSLTRDVDSISLGILQIGFVGLYALAFSLAFERPKLPETGQLWLIVLALSIFCSAFGYIAQTLAQKYTTPTHTGLIYSLEPAFAAAFAYFFAGEVLSVRAYMGAVIMLISIILLEVDFRNIRKRPQGIKETQ